MRVAHSKPTPQLRFSITPGLGWLPLAKTHDKALNSIGIDLFSANTLALQPKFPARLIQQSRLSGRGGSVDHS